DPVRTLVFGHHRRDRPRPFAAGLCGPRPFWIHTNRAGLESQIFQWRVRGYRWPVDFRIRRGLKNNDHSHTSALPAAAWRPSSHESPSGMVEAGTTTVLSHTRGR